MHFRIQFIVKFTMSKSSKINISLKTARLWDNKKRLENDPF
jgi:hypothetical protein